MAANDSGEIERAPQTQPEVAGASQDGSIHFVAASFSGPLPDLETLQAYDMVLPGLAERIVNRWETQSNHRMSLEKSVIEDDNRRRELGFGQRHDYLAFCFGRVGTARHARPRNGRGSSGRCGHRGFGRCFRLWHEHAKTGAHRKDESNDRSNRKTLLMQQPAEKSAGCLFLGDAATMGMVLETGLSDVGQLQGNNATIVCVLPAFRRNGLLPEGEHLCEWPEFVLRFGGTADNGRRRNLLFGLARMLFLLREAGCHVVLVDGSFVTRERWPKDFDVCYEEEGWDSELLPAVLQDVSMGRAAQKAAFGGEALPATFPFDFGGRTVREAFTQSRTHETKGLVRLELETVQTQIIDWLEEIEGGQTDATNTG